MITGDKRNYRLHTQKNKELIEKSLLECGAGRSILIDNNEEIIAGNGIYEQAKALNIPIRTIESDGSVLFAIKRTDLSTEDSKRKQLAIMDNTTSDSSEFDIEKLTEDFEKLELEDFGFDETLLSFEADIEKNPSQFTFDNWRYADNTQNTEHSIEENPYQMNRIFKIIINSSSEKEQREVTDILDRLDLRYNTRNYIQDEKDTENFKRNYREDLIEKSLMQFGTGKSVLLDKDNNVICGNIVLRIADRLKIPIQVIESTGDKLVAVKRLDLSLSDLKGKSLALIDNIVSENVLWNKHKILKEYTHEDLKNLGFDLNKVPMEINDAFCININCENEEDQERIYTLLAREGIECQVQSL